MARSTTAGQAVRILLIEDESAFVYLLRRALDAQRFRYLLTALDDGEEALAFIRKEGKSARAEPGLVVMDLHLSKKDGMEILTAMRRTTKFADVPVAILSGSQSPEEKQRVAAFDKTCFIPKPCDLEEFDQVGKRIKQLALEGTIA